MDISEIWKNQEIFEPNLNQFTKNIDSFKNKNLKNIILVNILFILTSIFIIWIWIYFQPKLITTKIGITITILSMFIYIIALNKTIALNKEKFDINNNQYLKQLINLKIKQKFLQNTMMKIYFIMLSFGICLYLIEYVLLMSFTMGIIVYATTLIWVTINWFYFRPKIIKKQNLKINELIYKFEKINNQINCK